MGLAIDLQTDLLLSVTTSLYSTYGKSNHQDNSQKRKNLIGVLNENRVKNLLVYPVTKSGDREHQKFSIRLWTTNHDEVDIGAITTSLCLFAQQDSDVDCGQF